MVQSSVTRRAGASLILLMAFAGRAQAMPAGIEVLALDGAEVDGGAPGATHHTLGLPGVDDLGPYFFSQYLKTPSPPEFVQAIFATDEAGARYEKVARPPDQLFFDSSTYVMSKTSRLLLAGFDLQSGSAGQAVLRERPTLDGFDAFGPTGTQAPSEATPGALFEDDHASLMITPSGEIAFANNLQLGAGGVTSENDRGVWWTLPAGSLAIAAQKGDPLPGLPGEAAFPFLFDFGEEGALIDSGGFRVFHPKSGDPRVVAGVGQPFPDDAGETFNEIFIPRLNDAGDIFFVGSGAATGSHLFGPDGEGGLVRWVSEGDDATAAGASFWFDSFAASSLRELSVNEAGRVLFFATLASKGSGVRDSIWIASAPGELELVALAYSGAEIQTRNAGAVACRIFESFALLNDLGEAVFQCRGLGAESSILYASGGAVTLVVQTGQVWEVEPEVFATILSFDVDDGIGNANASRPTSAFGDSGFAFRARLDDGARTGLFYVADPTLVPEAERALGGAVAVGMVVAFRACRRLGRR